MQPAPRGFQVSSLTMSVYLPAFLLAVGMGATIPVLPLLGLDLGMSLAMAGALVAVRSIGTALFNIPAGILVSRIGERRAMVWSALTLAVVAAGIGAQPAIPLLLLLVALMGAAWAVLLLARVAYAAEIAPPPQRGRVMSMLGGSHRFGSLVGPLLGSLVVAWFGLPAAFYLQVLFAGLAFVTLFASTPDIERAESEPAGLTRAAVAYLRTHRRLFAFMSIVTISIQLLRSGRDVLLPLWGSQIDLSASQISLIFGLSVAFEMLFFYPAGIVSDRYGRKWSGIPCIVAMAIGVALIPFAQGMKGLVIAGLMLGLGNGLGAGIQMTLGSDISPERGRAAFFGLWRMVTDTGNIAGPLLIAVTAAWATLGFAAVILSGLGVAGALVMGLFVPDTLRGIPRRDPA